MADVQHTEHSHDDSSTLQPVSSVMRLFGVARMPLLPHSLQRSQSSSGTRAALLLFILIVYFESVIVPEHSVWRKFFCVIELLLVGVMGSLLWQTRREGRIAVAEWAAILVSAASLCLAFLGLTAIEFFKIAVVAKVWTVDSTTPPAQQPPKDMEERLRRVAEQLQDLRKTPEIARVSKADERIACCLNSVMSLIGAHPSAGSHDTDGDNELRIPDISTVQSAVPYPQLSLFADITSFSFNVFTLKDASQNHPLQAIGSHLLIQSGLCGDLLIPSEKVASLLCSLESLYNPLPYHSCTHAADVVQAVHCFLTFSDDLLTQTEEMTLYIAAAAHDVGHPGVNNVFLVATRSPLAVLYNDKSVLENHHAATLFGLIAKDENAVFGSFSEDEFRRVRCALIEMILYTDMKDHSQLVAAIKAQPLPSISPGTLRSTFLAFLLHCADISNPARPWSLAYKWCQLLLDEFFAQGDQEARLGLPLGPLNDRNRLNIPKCQTGFIDALVVPTFTVLQSFLPKAQELTNALKENRELWEEREGKQS